MSCHCGHSCEYNRPVYKVVFSDGSEILADEQHEWYTLTAKANETREYDYLEPMKGQIRTTLELYETLYHRGRANHMIPVTKPLELPEKELPIDPYVLGVWLGDGYSSSGTITTADLEILEEIRQAGYTIRPRKAPYAYGIEGLTTQLRALGVLHDKHIPTSYLRASKEQRLALLQGIMDTDGTVTKNGWVEIQLTSKVLAEGVHELILSLGIKVTIREGRAKLNGKDCGAKYRMKFASCLPLFRLERKRSKQKQTGFKGMHEVRYITDIQPVESVPVKCIEVDSPSHLYLAGKTMIPTHNSSCLLMAALQYVMVPGYSALILRKTYKDLALPGALMDRAHQWLSQTDAVWNENKKTWTFPSGATLTFGYMEADKDKYRYQGSEFQFIGFDELTQFSEEQYTYMFSRLRKLEGSRVPVRVRSASNPGGVGHNWVYQRFFVEKKGPFIPARLDDNPYLNAEEYRQALSNLDPVTREQLLNGDWNIRQGAGFFKREWFNIIPQNQVPAQAFQNAVRFWDLAATPPSDINKDPDWTVGALVGEYQGRYYILDIQRTRSTPQGVENLVKQTAQMDGIGVRIWMEQEPGSSGVNTVDHYRRNVLKGYAFYAERSTGSKLQRATPLSSAAEAGNVFFVQATWNRDLLDELELFPTPGVHDDMVDAVAGAFNKVTRIEKPKARVRLY